VDQVCISNQGGPKGPADRGETRERDVLPIFQKVKDHQQNLPYGEKKLFALLAKEARKKTGPRDIGGEVKGDPSMKTGKKGVKSFIGGRRLNI